MNLHYLKQHIKYIFTQGKNLSSICNDRSRLYNGKITETLNYKSIIDNYNIIKQKNWKSSYTLS